MRHRLAPIALCSLALPAAAQTVLVVDSTSNAPGVFSSLQEALDTAQPGDTVAVRSLISPSGQITAKAIHLIGLKTEFGFDPIVYDLQVRDLAPGQQVVVSGFAIEDSTAGVQVADCAGRVLLEDLSEGHVRVTGSSSVTLARCDLTENVEVIDSHVNITDCQLQAGVQDPAPSLRMEGSTGFIQGTTVIGSQGAPGENPSFFVCTDGGDGGVGLELVSSTLAGIDSTVLGGPGGQASGGCSNGADGVAIAGSGYSTLPAPAASHRLVTNTPTQLPASLVVEAQGEPGELVSLYISTGLGDLFLPTWNAPLLVDPAGGSFFGVGAVSGAGSLELTFDLTLPPTLGVLSLPVQGMFVHPSGQGPNYLSGVTWVDVYDAALPFADCDDDGQNDAYELATGLDQDCNGNGVVDGCDIAAGVEEDCNGNGVPDSCDLASGASVDLDGNGILDDCEFILQVPSEYPTIEAAVNASTPGDTILIANGVYRGSQNVSISIPVAQLTIASVGGPDNCILDLTSTSLAGFETAFTTERLEVRGITFLDDGLAPQPSSAALEARTEKLLVEDCRFVRCAPTSSGQYALNVELYGDAVVRRCEFIDCDRAALVREGFSGAGQSIRFEECRFTGNTSPANQGGAIYAIGSGFGTYEPGDGPSVLLRNCLFEDNTAQGSGGAVSAARCDLRVSGCTFVGNTAQGPGPGGGSLYVRDGGLDVSGSIFWDGNSQGPGDEVTIEPTAIPLNPGGALRYSAVGDGPFEVSSPLGFPAFGPGVIHADPLFVAAGLGDWNLTAASPCADTGDPGFVPEPGETDLEGGPRLVGAAVDMGALERDL